MEATILTVMVGLAAVGFGVLRLMWRSLDGRMDRLDGRMDRLDGRMDRLDGRMDRLEEQRETDRREVIGMLVVQARQLGRIEGNLGLAPEPAGDPPPASEAAAAV